jgi:hypothetical protein
VKVFGRDRLSAGTARLAGVRKPAQSTEADLGAKLLGRLTKPT